MPWTCPNCKRSFRNTNQSHSCVVVTLKSLFVGKNPLMWKVYRKLFDHLKNYDGIKISPVKNAILFSVNTNFLAIKPKPNWLDVEFISIQKIDEFPVHKSIRISKKKHINFIRLESLENIDTQLKDWFREAYYIDTK